MKYYPKYYCPVCGKRYFRFTDMEQCAELDSKSIQKKQTITNGNSNI
jgi:hypothetical protein